MNASTTVLGCPVILRVKNNETFHGIFVTFTPEFDVLLECCHKVDPKNEVYLLNFLNVEKFQTQVVLHVKIFYLTCVRW
jgi:small nuclear ribonucleoprotein (snRNP)-like protein